MSEVNTATDDAFDKVQAAEKSLEVIIAEAQAAWAPIQALLEKVGPLLPGHLMQAVAPLACIMAAAPGLLHDAEQFTTDLHNAVANAVTAAQAAK